MSLLTRPIINPNPALARMTVTLYTRAQCCCCQTAREVLEGYREAARLPVRGGGRLRPGPGRPDRDDGPGRSPSTAKVRFRGEVNRVLFERLLASRQGL